jgi:glycosyltransferase involved in cell wall biosynthesis
MACGCPVVASNSSSIPEVVGDAAIMIDPFDIDALAKSMYEVLTTDELRGEMIKRGLDRSKQFSWDKCVRESLIAIEEANING